MPRPGKEYPVVAPQVESGPLRIKRCEEGHEMVLWRCTGADTEPCWFCGGQGKQSAYWTPGYTAGWYYVVAARQAGAFPDFGG
jgi:hypothetical protein